MLSDAQRTLCVVTLSTAARRDDAPPSLIQSQREPVCVCGRDQNPSKSSISYFQSWHIYFSPDHRRRTESQVSILNLSIPKVHHIIID